MVDTPSKTTVGLETSKVAMNQPPRSLREALGSDRTRGLAVDTDSGIDEEYNDQSQQPPKAVAVLLSSRLGDRTRPNKGTLRRCSGLDTPSDSASEIEALDPVAVLHAEELENAKIYTVASDDDELQEILRRGMQMAKDGVYRPIRSAKFRDFAFSRRFSTFDRQNPESSNSIFHGFYTLFWISVVLGMFKVAADNWKRTGSIMGTNDIMNYMFRKDVVVMLLSDGLMCSLTGVSWLLQLLILQGHLDWDRSGWIIQNVWQTIFIAGGIGWTQLRDWPWSHTVFFVMHILVMLMKQHSYAFYNGYLSTIHRRRIGLSATIDRLNNIKQVKAPSRTRPPAAAVTTSHLASLPNASSVKQRRRSSQQHANGENDLDTIASAVESGKPLDASQVEVFRKVIKWELDFLDEELKGKATETSRAYPYNLTFSNHYEYIPLPTLVYELEYPRSESVDWYYVAEKLVATFGVLMVMMMISQAFIYPVILQTEEMKELGVPVMDRMKVFPWMFSDLLFPLMGELLLSWYLIWEVILNLLAELTCFADRTFYRDWWNSVTWEQYARDWNRPVHAFLLRHVYHSSISALKVDKYTATLITFFLSACVHELVMWCIFKKLRGYLLLLQMSQLPLVALSRTRFLKDRKTLGNTIFWGGLFLGPSTLCSLYLVL